MAGLSQIGGLLAVFKLSLTLLFFLNRFWFVKKVKEFLVSKQIGVNHTVIDNCIQQRDTTSIDASSHIMTVVPTFESPENRYSIENFESMLQDNKQMKK